MYCISNLRIRPRGPLRKRSRRDLRILLSQLADSGGVSLALSILFYSRSRHVRHACNTPVTVPRREPRKTPPAPPPPPPPSPAHTRILRQESQGPSTHPPKSEAAGLLQPASALCPLASPVTPVASPTTTTSSPLGIRGTRAQSRPFQLRPPATPGAAASARDYPGRPSAAGALEGGLPPVELGLKRAQTISK